MIFRIKDKNETVIGLTRKIGYRPLGVNGNNEYSIVKELNNSGYPRFHIYIIKDDDGDFRINLHLDRKRTSYKSKGVFAHNADYQGELVEKEANRILNIFKKD